MRFDIGKHVMVLTSCPACHVEYMLPETLYERGLKKGTRASIFCPSGHEWHFTDSVSEEAKLREELRLANIDRASKREIIRERGDEIERLRKQVKRLHGKADVKRKPSARKT